MEATTIGLPVVQVTLLEDRAQVVRQGTIDLVAGMNCLRIERVSPVLVDKTLSVSLDGDGDIAEARVERRRVVREAERPEAVAELDRLARELADEERKLARQQAMVAGHAGGLVRAADLAVTELGEDASWGQVDPEGWESRFELLHMAEAEQRGHLVELARAAQDMATRKRDLAVRRQALSDPRTWLRADLVVVVSAKAACSASLRAEYLVPGACWRPWHRASLGDGKLGFRTDGCVWQDTGEDWNDVRLFFSTGRASLGTRPPDLVADELRLRRVDQEVRVEAREQEIHTAGLGAAATVTTPEMPGIDDGGETRRFAAMAPARVPSDGRPHRFPAMSFETAAREQRVLLAELVQAVILRTEQDNRSVLPILPGPVDLVRESGQIGRTWVDFVAPGERFELGWGPDLALRVHREHEREQLDSKLFSSWTATRHEVTVRVSNIGPDEVEVDLTERIPVSELDKVRIDLKSTVPAAAPDSDGMLRWTLTLPGYGQGEITYEHEVRRHPDVRGLDL